MKPQGRRKVKLQNAKHKPKEDGKHVTGWWENIVCLCKKRDRREAKQDINQQVNELNSRTD